MSLETVLKNVYTFAQIVSQASSNSVSQWDEKSFKNAFNWAAYCEQVYEHVEDKPFKVNFDEQIQEITSLLSPPSCVCLNLESLKTASDILQERLLLNPYLKLEIFDRLVIGNGGTSFTSDHISQKIHGLVSLISSAKLSRNLLEEIEEDKTCIHPHQIPAQSKILFQHFIEQFTTIPKIDRFCSYIKSVLNRIADISGGMVIILCLVAVYQENKSDCEDGCDKINQTVLSWIETIANIKPQKILSIEKGILCEISAGSSEFLNLYMQILVEWAKLMKPRSGGLLSTKSYRWSAVKECKLGSYENLLEHFSFLSSSQRYFENMVSDGLNKLKGSDMFSIWSDILEEIKKKYMIGLKNITGLKYKPL
ncbi:uncharacterized protein LOC126831122 [Patella vulgata]|uniref:uncharacterized protein LOC126831122 n=1 Tax=Patella vulgata TaxID=6465 RepID=UPI0024A99B91|nr:uncharacterized protein LOC126831122 [Patella vulgata]XP_055958899.1 uncharacterized protein LOC126831122 [Patella vulgata]